VKYQIFIKTYIAGRKMQAYRSYNHSRYPRTTTDDRKMTDFG